MNGKYNIDWNTNIVEIEQEIHVPCCGTSVPRLVDSIGNAEMEIAASIGVIIAWARGVKNVEFFNDGLQAHTNYIYVAVGARVEFNSIDDAYSFSIELSRREWKGN